MTSVDQISITIIKTPRWSLYRREILLKDETLLVVLDLNPLVLNFPPSTWDSPGRTVTWDPSNVSFPGEETAGTIGCYLCGDSHYTSEHQARRRSPHRNLTPPPSYPVATTPTRMTTYESIPDQPTTSTSTNTSHEPPNYAHPPINRPFRFPTMPRTNRGHGSTTRGRPLQSRIAEGSHRQRRSSNEEMFLLDSDAEHNNNT